MSLLMFTENGEFIKKIYTTSVHFLIFDVVYSNQIDILINYSYYFKLMSFDIISSKLIKSNCFIDENGIFESEFNNSNIIRNKSNSNIIYVYNTNTFDIESFTF